MWECDQGPCGRCLDRGVTGRCGCGMHSGGLGGRKRSLEGTCTHRALALCPALHVVLETRPCPLPFLRASWLLWDPWPLCLPPLSSYGNVVWYLVAELKRLNWDLGHLGPFTRMS